MRSRLQSRPVKCCFRRWRRQFEKSTPTSFLKSLHCRLAADRSTTLTGSVLKRAVDTAMRVATLLLLAANVTAAGLDLPSSEPKLLPPEQAFRFSARALDSNTLEARFDVASGYYLYREKLH